MKATSSASNSWTGSAGLDVLVGGMATATEEEEEAAADDVEDGREGARTTRLADLTQADWAPTVEEGSAEAGGEAKTADVVGVAAEEDEEDREEARTTGWGSETAGEGVDAADEREAPARL